MSTPEDEIRFAAAFNELGESAELMVEPPTAAAIRGKVRRRRATRVTVAAVAALALVAPASWALQQAATAEEREAPSIAEERTTEATAGEDSVKPQEPTPSDEPSAERETIEYDAPPTFDELVGTALDLPSFIPGAGIDEVCPVDGAVLEDGRNGGYMDGGGRIGLLEVVHTPMGEGSRDFPVLLLGCRFGEAAAYQVVLLDQSEGTGEWYTWTQLSHSVMNADRPYDIAADPDYGVLIGVAERYACCATDPDELDYWVERARLDGESDVVLERVEDGPLTNVSVSVESTGTNADGFTEIIVRVLNEGDVASGDFLLSACADPEEIQADFSVQDCTEGMHVVEAIGPLQPGEEHSTSWEVAASGGAILRFEIDPDTFTTAGIARDLVFADNSGYYEWAL